MEFVAVAKLPEVVPGLGKSQAYEWVNEMYLDPEFAKGVVKPTGRKTFVRLDYLWRYMERLEIT